MRSRPKPFVGVWPRHGILDVSFGRPQARPGPRRRRSPLVHAPRGSWHLQGRIELLVAAPRPRPTTLVVDRLNNGLQQLLRCRKVFADLGLCHRRSELAGGQASEVRILSPRFVEDAGSVPSSWTEWSMHQLALRLGKSRREPGITPLGWTAPRLSSRDVPPQFRGNSAGQIDGAVVAVSSHRLASSAFARLKNDLSQSAHLMGCRQNHVA